MRVGVGKEDTSVGAALELSGPIWENGDDGNGSTVDVGVFEENVVCNKEESKLFWTVDDGKTTSGNEEEDGVFVVEDDSVTLLEKVRVVSGVKIVDDMVWSGDDEDTTALLEIIVVSDDRYTDEGVFEVTREDDTCAELEGVMVSEVTATDNDSTGVLVDDDMSKLLEVVVVSENAGVDRGAFEEISDDDSPWLLDAVVLSTITWVEDGVLDVVVEDIDSEDVDEVVGSAPMIEGYPEGGGTGMTVISLPKITGSSEFKEGAELVSLWEGTSPNVTAKERRIGPAEQEHDHASVVKTTRRVIRMVVWLGEKERKRRKSVLIRKASNAAKGTWSRVEKSIVNGSYKINESMA